MCALLLWFTVHSWEKSSFALTHCSIWRNSHRHNRPALEVSYLPSPSGSVWLSNVLGTESLPAQFLARAHLGYMIGRWQWCTSLDGVKLICLKLASLQSLEIHSLPPLMDHARQ